METMFSETCRILISKNRGEIRIDSDIIDGYYIYVQI